MPSQAEATIFAFGLLREIGAVFRCGASTKSISGVVEVQITDTEDAAHSTTFAEDLATSAYFAARRRRDIVEAAIVAVEANRLGTVDETLGDFRVPAIWSQKAVKRTVAAS